ncbi:cyclin-like protein [Mollisia scopiformis]|uniref:RNA polymerase II holoenzyme cyclin-like subunit n=1 Tax=Mollisia scopiformis TaxID=149040 RepID=A0A132B5L9_MOLSC|nr:cyclin-like protein [Mollisia scopiformis]KUJ07543.1 cyclin-like protein [Mollisia scopiformis]
MTTVERYRPPHHFHSDAPSNDRRPHSSANPITKDIPPAVPSPPRLFTRTSPPRRPQVPPIPSPISKMADDESSQWIFTDEEMLSTPSILDGITPVEERCRRAKGVNFITQAGILLKLPQLTLAVASTFFQRFYMRRSLVPERGGIHQYLPRSQSHKQLKSKEGSLTLTPEQSIAATALFLATKTEENCRKTKEIVIAVAKVAQKNASLIIDEQSKEYWRWRDSILLYEETMLEELTFDLVLKSPYTVLYIFLQQLNLGENKLVRNVAWAFLNDSCMTTLSLTQTAKDIAVAAVYFALKFQNESIPDDEYGTAWWETLGGNPEIITKAVDVLTTFWSENPLSRKDIPYAENPVSGDDLEQTRRRESDGSSTSVASQNGDAKRSPEQKPTPDEKPSPEDKSRPDTKLSPEDQPGTEAKPSPKRKLEEAEIEEGEEPEPETKRAKTQESTQSQTQ